MDDQVGGLGEKGMKVRDKVVGVELGGRGKGYLDGGFKRVEMPLGESPARPGIIGFGSPVQNRVEGRVQGSYTFISRTLDARER